LLGHHAKKVQRVGVVRFPPQNLAIEPLRFRQTASLMVRQSSLKVFIRRRLVWASIRWRAHAALLVLPAASAGARIISSDAGHQTLPLQIGRILEARVGIEPTHKGFAVFRPSSNLLIITADSVE
jgi:hypothetical protein